MYYLCKGPRNFGHLQGVFFYIGAPICYKVCNVLSPEFVAPGALQDPEPTCFLGGSGMIRNHIHSAQSLKHISCIVTLISKPTTAL